jgi:Tfp pilus assembly protein FimT
LTVVLVLIGVMLAISAPRFRQSLLTNTLNSVTRRIIALVHDARDRSVHEQVNIRCYFDMTNNLIWCDSSPAATGGSMTEQEKKYRLPVDVRIQDIWSLEFGKRSLGEATILFSPKGYAEPAMIHLATRDGRQVSLELAPFLGAVKVYEGYVEARAN